MTMLIIGVLLFACVHLVPSLAPGVKASWYAKLGEGGYKGSFSLLLLASFALMVLGWRSAQPQFLYVTPAGLRHGAMAVICLAFFLLVISNRPSRLRQWIRHPQLTGIILWSLAHLAINGDSRSLLLFGGLALWASLEIIAINKRDGLAKKPAPTALSADFISVLISVVLIAIVMAIHPYISGMPIF